MKRDIRYQGAILREHRILLLRHLERASGRGYWVLPGGGRELGESERDCVRREMREETGLVVTVQELLLDEPGEEGEVYRRRKTYACDAPGGEPQPGFEPEDGIQYSIVEVRWFDLRDTSAWDEDLVADPFTFPQLERMRKKLGYSKS